MHLATYGGYSAMLYDLYLTAAGWLCARGFPLPIQAQQAPEVCSALLVELLPSDYGRVAVRKPSRPFTFLGALNFVLLIVCLPCCVHLLYAPRTRRFLVLSSEELHLPFA